MIKYKGAEIFLVQMLGKWYGVIFFNSLKFQTAGYDMRKSARFEAEEIVESVTEYVREIKQSVKV